jgi:branched-chain amino acid transport system permease protein
MTFLSQIIQYVISGITSGSIYAIVGVCWSTVFLITNVLNFATGEFVMLGGMLTWVFIGLGLGLAPAAMLAILCTIIIAILLERLGIRPVKYPSEITYMIITIASASVIKIESIRILDATLTPQVLIVIGVLIIVTVGLFLFFNLTLFGKALRASAFNFNGARLIGIEINRFRLFCFGLAGALCAIAGIVITPIAFTGYGIGLMTGLKGLVAAIVGGWSVFGTVLAGLALGLLEGFSAGLLSPGWKDAIALFVMILFLVLRTLSFSLGLKKESS